MKSHGRVRHFRLYIDYNNVVAAGSPPDHRDQLTKEKAPKCQGPIHYRLDLSHMWAWYMPVMAKRMNEKWTEPVY